MHIYYNFLNFMEFNKKYYIMKKILYYEKDNYNMALIISLSSLLIS